MTKTNTTLPALICVATMVWAGSAAALNPQPLPPRRLPQTITTNSNVLERTGTRDASMHHYMHNGVNAGMRRLNPQPLPPG
jgi:hypothetical protein